MRQTSTEFFYIDPTNLDLLHRVYDQLKVIYCNWFVREELARRVIDPQKQNKASFARLKLFLRKYGLGQVMSGQVPQPAEQKAGYLPDLSTYVPTLTKLWLPAIEQNHLKELKFSKGQEAGKLFKLSSFCYFLLLCASKVYQTNLGNVLERIEVSEGLKELRAQQGCNLSFIKAMLQRSRKKVSDVSAILEE